MDVILLHRLGVNVFAIDYRGYGSSSPGMPNEKRVYDDARAAFTYLTVQRGVPSRDIILEGHSLGTGPATEMAKEHPDIGGLVLVSPLTSTPDIAKVVPEFWYLRAIPVELLSHNKFDNLSKHLIRMGHRLKSAPTIQELLALDGRSPVLYLRSFIQEYQAFVVGRHARYGAYARSWHASVSQPEQNIAITLEEYLSPAINEKVGPFVALGGPEDYISPTGAMRVYCRDEEWMQQFSTLARQSACIIAQLGKSNNMRWEFDHLRREGLQEKLCIITRHSGKRMFWESLKGIPAVSWQQFSGELAQLGYDLGFAHPGPGSVIAFDAEGHGIVLTSRADLPEDFVKPILTWVINHQPPCQPVTK